MKGHFGQIQTTSLSTIRASNHRDFPEPLLRLGWVHGDLTALACICRDLTPGVMAFSGSVEVRGDAGADVDSFSKSACEWMRERASGNDGGLRLWVGTFNVLFGHRKSVVYLLGTYISQLPTRKKSRDDLRVHRFFRRVCPFHSTYVCFERRRRSLLVCLRNALANVKCRSSTYRSSRVWGRRWGRPVLSTQAMIDSASTINSAAR